MLLNVPRYRGCEAFAESLVHSFCQRRTCGIRGTDNGIRVGKKDYELDVPELVRRIREKLSAAP